MENYPKRQSIQRKFGLIFLSISDLDNPTEPILEMVNSKDYDLVVFGTCGMNVFRKLILGSASIKFMHHAKCHVMVV